MRCDSILSSIGRTPHVRLSRLFPDHEVWAKLENFNPGSSIKDRIALRMIDEAERAGIISPQRTLIIEPTSGNTGIGLAMVAAVKGYRLLLVMPESMSIERRKIMIGLGAKLELTPKEKGMKGAIERANELMSSDPYTWMPMQFDNPANVMVHRDTTAQEILADFPDGLDYLVTGVGTGGHITGCAEVLKEQFRQLKVYAVEPTLSPVLSGGSHSPHPIQGIGAGFIPSILKRELLDRILQVEPPSAFAYVRAAALKEGLLVGISSGAALAAVAGILGEVSAGARILTFCYDTGERYLSVEALFG